MRPGGDRHRRRHRTTPRCARTSSIGTSVSERGGNVDGNGVPGDEFGVNLAHLAIAARRRRHARGARAPPPTSRTGPALTSAPGRDWGHRTDRGVDRRGSGANQSRIGVRSARADSRRSTCGENLRTAPDPAQRRRPAHAQRRRRRRAAARQLGTARAAAIVYAVGEALARAHLRVAGAAGRTGSCDALLFAEDNCALPVCGPGDEPSATAPTPRTGATHRLERHGGEAPAWWSTRGRAEALERSARPLRATAGRGGRSDPGHRTPISCCPSPAACGSCIDGAVSNPWNDGTTIPDKRTAPVTGSAGRGRPRRRRCRARHRHAPGHRALGDPPGAGRRRGEAAQRQRRASRCPNALCGDRPARRGRLPRAPEARPEPRGVAVVCGPRSRSKVNPEKEGGQRSGPARESKRTRLARMGTELEGERSPRRSSRSRPQRARRRRFPACPTSSGATASSPANSAESTFTDQSTSAEQAELAQLARDATAAAEQELDLISATMFWRLAALSAWQVRAGKMRPARGIVAGGTAACQRVSAARLRRAGNCLTIYMTPIRADYDRTKATSRRSAGQAWPLASADGAQAVAWFDGPQSDFQKASAQGDASAPSRIDPGAARRGRLGPEEDHLPGARGPGAARVRSVSGNDARAVAPVRRARLETLRGGLGSRAAATAPCLTARPGAASRAVEGVVPGRTDSSASSASVIVDGRAEHGRRAHDRASSPRSVTRLERHRDGCEFAAGAAGDRSVSG